MTKLVGSQPYQSPRNADLGSLAFIDHDSVGTLKGHTVVLGDPDHADRHDGYNLSIRRSAGGSGALRIVGDSYYSGNAHIKFENYATSSSGVASGMITFDGNKIRSSALQINTGLTQDHVSGQPGLEVYHYNYPDDNTINVAAMKIRVGNNDGDLKHHGFLSLEQIFTGGTYQSPYIWFRNNANSSNDKALIGINLDTGTIPALKFTYDLIGSSENYVDIVETEGSNAFAALHPKGGFQIGGTNIYSGSFYANGESNTEKYGIFLSRDVSSQNDVPVIRMSSNYSAGTVTTSEFYTNTSGTTLQQLNSSRSNKFMAPLNNEFVSGDVQIANKISIYGKTPGSANITPSEDDWVDIASIPYGESKGRVRVQWDGLSAPGSAHHGMIELEIGSWYGPQYYYGWDSYINITKVAAHNHFTFKNFKLVDAGNTLVLQGQADRTVSAGSFTNFVLEDHEYGPGSGGEITAMTPAVNNVRNGTINAYVKLNSSPSFSRADNRVKGATSGVQYARYGYLQGRAYDRSYTNPNGMTFTIATGSNGAASYIIFEGNEYRGTRRVYFRCVNYSGNWTIYQDNVQVDGTGPVYTINNNSTANPSITVSCSTSYSGGFLHVKADPAYWYLS